MRQTDLRIAAALKALLVPAALGTAVWLAPAIEGRANTPLDAAARPEVAEAVSAILAMEADPAYGAYLAGECVTCHRQSGGSDGIPPIVGLSAEEMVTALVEYRAGIRDNEVMTVRAARLADEEIAALAAHFAAQ